MRIRIDLHKQINTKNMWIIKLIFAMKRIRFDVLSEITKSSFALRLIFLKDTIEFLNTFMTNLLLFLLYLRTLLNEKFENKTDWMKIDEMKKRYWKKNKYYLRWNQSWWYVEQWKNHRMMHDDKSIQNLSKDI